MNAIENNNDAKINNIINVVKIISLLFCVLVICNNLSSYSDELSNSIEIYFNMHPIGELSIIIILIYLLWFFSYFKPSKTHKKCVLMIQNLIFIAIFSFIIVFARSYVYEYKLLFVFIIISATLQCGMESGMFLAIVSAVIIFLIDFTFFSVKGTVLIIQDDIILSGVFLLTAWPIGMYTKTREENIRQKSLELNELNYELAHQHNERRYIEQVFMKNQECYSLVIENSRDAIFIHIKDRIIFANESALRLLGVKAQEIENKGIEAFIYDDGKEKLIDIMGKVIEEKQTNVRFETYFTNQKGRQIAVENILNYISYNGKAAIITIVHDISYEKEIEGLKVDVKKNFELLNKTIKLNNSITQLFVNMSHELKTPLNVIFSALQVLIMGSRNGNINEDKKLEYFYVMKQNCYRLMKLINNFLMLTKVDSGMVDTRFKNDDIVKRVEDITVRVAEYNKKRNINITFDTDIEEKIIAFDSDLISKVILNLLSNAVKYCDKEGEIFVSIWNDDDGVSISVKDNGVGIPEDKMQFIFERFGQMDKTLAREFEGTGVGLSIVKALIQLHRGTIEIKSDTGKGSEFIITLPNRIIEDEEADEIIGDSFQTDMEKIYIEFSDIY